MTTTNSYGRQVVVPLTNKSGGGVIAGDVVIVDTGNNDAFTTSTAGAVTGGVGIAQEIIASNATGRVLTEGYAALVNTSASVTRGNFGKTHTVVKQAVDAGSSRVTGTFCQFLTGGTTPDAIVWQPDLGAGSGTAGTTRILDYTLGSDITALALTNNTWVDLISNQNFTVASASSIVEIAVRAYAFTTGAAGQMVAATRANIDSGGTPILENIGGNTVESTAQRGNPFAGSGSIFLSGLTAAVHTIKLQCYVNSGSITFYCRPTGAAPAPVEFLRIQIIEHKN